MPLAFIPPIPPYPPLPVAPPKLPPGKIKPVKDTIRDLTRTWRNIGDFLKKQRLPRIPNPANFDWPISPPVLPPLPPPFKGGQCVGQSYRIIADSASRGTTQRTDVTLPGPISQVTWVPGVYPTNPGYRITSGLGTSIYYHGYGSQSSIQAAFPIGVAVIPVGNAQDLCGDPAPPEGFQPIPDRRIKTPPIFIPRVIPPGIEPDEEDKRRKKPVPKPFRLPQKQPEPPPFREPEPLVPPAPFPEPTPPFLPIPPEDPIPPVRPLPPEYPPAPPRLPPAPRPKNPVKPIAKPVPDEPVPVPTGIPYPQPFPVPVPVDPSPTPDDRCNLDLCDLAGMLPTLPPGQECNWLSVNIPFVYYGPEECELALQQVWVDGDRWNSGMMEVFTVSAEKGLARCEDGIVELAIPDYWQVKKGAGTPQLVFVFRSSAGSRSYHSYSIPHPSITTAPQTFPFQSFTKGRWHGVLELSDNSKVRVNCSTKSGCQTYIGVAVGLINSAFLEGVQGRYTENLDYAISEAQMLPHSIAYFPQGQRQTAPLWKALYNPETRQLKQVYTF